MNSLPDSDHEISRNTKENRVLVRSRTDAVRFISDTSILTAEHLRQETWRER
jgi:hypothetical protein